MTTQKLRKRIFTESVHGITHQVTGEGWLEAGALVRNVRWFDEADYCDPDATQLPRYAEPETCSFLASTDGGKSWYRQRAREMPEMD
jgi:hypothetical protein